MTQLLSLWWRKIMPRKTIVSISGVWRGPFFPRGAQSALSIRNPGHSQPCTICDENTMPLLHKKLLCDDEAYSCQYRIVVSWNEVDRVINSNSKSKLKTARPLHGYELPVAWLAASTILQLAYNTSFIGLDFGHVCRGAACYLHSWAFFFYHYLATGEITCSSTDKHESLAWRSSINT